ncbi:MAG: hypothetical protein ACRD21_07170 [Vicinamibacteria bacterium]
MLGLGGLAHDFRYGARSLARKPGLTAAVATLALGIGATSSLLSVVRGVLLRPLAYPDSEANRGAPSGLKRAAVLRWG